MAPPERPLSEGVDDCEGKLVEEVVAEIGADEDADVDEDGRSVGSAPVIESNWALSIVIEVAAGLADSRDE